MESSLSGEVGWGVVPIRILSTRTNRLRFNAVSTDAHFSNEEVPFDYTFPILCLSRGDLYSVFHISYWHVRPVFGQILFFLFKISQPQQ